MSNTQKLIQQKKNELKQLTRKLTKENRAAVANLLRKIAQQEKNKSFLAREIGITRVTIGNWLKGKTEITSRTHQRAIEKLAKKYGVEK
jgi:transcriptional regulator with XRE-family HTH domain